jgi:hypothetical protein
LTSSTVVARSTSNTQSVSEALASGTRTAWPFSLPAQLGEDLGDRGGRAGGGGDQAHAAGARAAQVLVRRVEDRLGVGQVVDGGDRAVADAELSWITLTTGARQLVVQEAAVTMRCTAGSKQVVVDAHHHVERAGSFTGAVTTTRLHALVQVGLQLRTACGTCRRPRSPRRSPTSRAGRRRYRAFVARYRKEATGGLDDTQLRLSGRTAGLSARTRGSSRGGARSISEQGKLTPELRPISAAETKQRLEDLYLPYKQKRRTKAQIAREAGLGRWPKNC